MQVASIVPTAYLHLIAGKPYHLCLAQVALRDPIYRDFYRKEAEAGSYVILDNGAAEGELVGIQEMKDLAVYLGASEIVLPDFLGNYERTLREARDALNYVKERGAFKGKIMAVPQGASLKEWILCASVMLTWHIDTIGIPKYLTSAFGVYARQVAFSWLLPSLVTLNKQVHFLGCGGDPREIGVMCRLAESVIRGVDSSLAYLYARDGYGLDVALMNNIPRSQKPVDFSDTTTDETQIEVNISQWEAICNGELL